MVNVKRGPKSAAESDADAAKIAVGLNVISGGFGGRETDDPPPELTEHESAIWRAVMKSEAKGLFGTAVLRGMLADYCRHKSSADKVSVQIGEIGGEVLKDPISAAHYKMLIQMRELETRAAVMIATKMRLTNQARYTPKAAGTATRNAGTQFQRPWDL